MKLLVLLAVAAALGFLSIVDALIFLLGWLTAMPAVPIAAERARVGAEYLRRYVPSSRRSCRVVRIGLWATFSVMAYLPASMPVTLLFLGTRGRWDLVLGVLLAIPLLTFAALMGLIRFPRTGYATARWMQKRHGIPGRPRQVSRA